MAFPAEGFLDLTRFMTHVGQLRHSTYNEYGETVITSVFTISCGVYQLDIFGNDTIPARTDRESHFAVISTPAALPDYYLTAVKDPGGNTVLADARVTRVIDYAHPQYGQRAKLLYLEITDSPGNA